MLIVDLSCYFKQHIHGQGEMSEELIIPHGNDILLGRGGKNNQHVGNEQLRKLARQNVQKYQLSSKKCKSRISRDLVHLIRTMDPPGRFLKRSHDSGAWTEVGEDTAREKASQALRDAVSALQSHGSFDEDMRPRANSAPPTTFRNTYPENHTPNHRLRYPSQVPRHSYPPYPDPRMFYKKMEYSPPYQAPTEIQSAVVSPDEPTPTKSSKRGRYFHPDRFSRSIKQERDGESYSYCHVSHPTSGSWNGNSYEEIRGPYGVVNDRHHHQPPRKHHSWDGGDEDRGFPYRPYNNPDHEFQSHRPWSQNQEVPMMTTSLPIEYDDIGCSFSLDEDDFAFFQNDSAPHVSSLACPKF